MIMTMMMVEMWAWLNCETDTQKTIWKKKKRKYDKLVGQCDMNNHLLEKTQAPGTDNRLMMRSTDIDVVVTFT